MIVFLNRIYENKNHLGVQTKLDLKHILNRTWINTSKPFPLMWSKKKKKKKGKMNWHSNACLFHKKRKKKGQNEGIII